MLQQKHEPVFDGANQIETEMDVLFKNLNWIGRVPIYIVFFNEQTYF